MALEDKELENLKMRRKQLWLMMNSVYGMNPSVPSDNMREKYIALHKEYDELGKKIKDHTRNEL